MKNLIVFLLFLITTNLSFSQSRFQSFIDRVNSLTLSSQKNAVVDSFLVVARNEGIPFIEDSSANFFYKGNANQVNIAGDFNGWNPNGYTFTKINGINFFYYSKYFEMNARLDYKFVLNGNTWILDPENPNKVSGGFGPNSELAMPEYIQPEEIIPIQNIPKGNRANYSIKSDTVGISYNLIVYLPPDYDSLESLEYPTAYFQDGGEYVNLGSAITIIDNLIYLKKIDPIIAVFVVPNNRNEDYAYSRRNKYAAFFAKELVPFIDEKYNTIRSSQSRLVLGDSFGGNISALISYFYPEVFAKCGLHSAAFWPNNYEVYDLIVNNPSKGIDYFSVYGTYESLYINMRQFDLNLSNRGDKIVSYEFPEGHSWGLWRANIDNMLEYFFPYQITSVGDELIVKDFNLLQNYPNPFNPSTKITFSIPQAQKVSVKIHDILGKEISVLLDQFMQSGKHEITFHAGSLPSGIYFCSLIAENYSKSIKMSFVK